VSGSETLSYTLNGSIAGLLPNPLLVAKDSAESDLKHNVIKDGTRYCVPFAQGAALLGAGVVTSGLPGLAGPTLTVAGGLTVAATSKLCADTVTRFVNDYHTYKDPPLYDVNVIAKPAAVEDPSLPSCKRDHGSTEKFCKRLRDAYTKLLMASGKLASISSAIEQTVSRGVAAYQDGDQSALSAQEADLSTLEGRKTSEISAERQAGKDVERALASKHIRVRLTKRQSGKTIARFEDKVGKDSITAGDISALDSSALKAAKTDLLKDLESL
jgi:hypothetical protein